MDRGAWGATGHGVTESDYHFNFPIIKVTCGYYVCMLSRSVMSDSATTTTVGHQAPLSLGFCRQEYRSGLPFPSPEDLPDSGIKTHVSCIDRRVLYY